MDPTPPTAPVEILPWILQTPPMDQTLPTVARSKFKAAPQCFSSYMTTLQRLSNLISLTKNVNLFNS
jgi:hypothetical protein